MDEVENPEVSAAGQTVLSADDGHVTYGSPEAIRPMLSLDTAAQSGLLPEGLDDSELSPIADGANGSPTATSSKPPLPRERIPLPVRPLLMRETSAPKPIALPGSALSAEVPDSPRDTPDSLTLAELRKIRDGFPVTPGSKQSLPVLTSVYDFEYDDPRNFALEIEEWFNYSSNEGAKILSLPDAFDITWATENETQNEDPEVIWRSSSARESFIRILLRYIGSDDGKDSAVVLACACYMCLGSFRETAGQNDKFPFRKLFSNPMEAPHLRGYEHSGVQVRTMIENSILFVRQGGLQRLLKVLRKLNDRDMTASLNLSMDTPDTSRVYDERNISDELWSCFTILHVLFEIARLGGDTADAAVIRTEVSALAPTFLLILTEMIGALRWDEAAPVPLSKIFMLHWKAVILAFGNIDKVEHVKDAFKDKSEETDTRGHPTITASPLDYHLFRQEISSKYPAYQPPKPSFPFEPDNNSILPPLRHRQSKYEVNNASAGGGSVSVGNGSIMHQPVHIATPAPSPPPSPAGPGGKGGKKQNYQTNQLFPFLYPPLDTSSNEIGGKGSTELQDALVGRKWQGCDIPASILEAAELFAKRMRATRAMKQLWKARVDFMKQERGWKDESRDAVSEFHLDLNDDFQDVDKFDATSPPTNNYETAESEEDRKEADKEHIEPLDKVAEFYVS